MIVLAFLPSVSALVVSSRSAAQGFTHGFFTTLGIAVGDIVFILIAIYGLSFLAGWMGNHFVFVKYLGGAYLMWLGAALWRSTPKAGRVEDNIQASLLSSFMTGLLITLGDQKAILFYLGFLPAFLDLGAVSVFDTATIIVISTVAIGAAKLVYAFMAARASVIFKDTKVHKGINIVVGSVMISVGVLLIAKA